MRIHKEGYKIIAITFILCAAISAALFLWTPAWLAWALTVILAGHLAMTMYFFREPSRPVLQDENLVYAPADGKVVVIEPVREKEYLGDDRIQVSVFMSITNVHINWFPVAGQVEYFKYHPGKFLVAWHPKSSEENERTTTVVNTGRHKVLFRQIAGMVARRIVSYVNVGEQARQNTQFGFIKFGSRIDIILPADTEILVQRGDRVTGSQTPIARLK